MQPFSKIVYLSLAGLSGIALTITLASLAWSRFKHRITFALADIRVISVIIICLCWVMMSAPSAFLWKSLAPLQFVQFPWRLGVIVEFFALTAVIAALALQTARPFSAKSAFNLAAVAIISLPIAGIALLTTANYSKFSGFYTERAWTMFDVSRSWTPVEYRPPTAIDSLSYRAGMAEAADKSGIRTQHDAGFRGLLTRVKSFDDIQLDRSIRPGERIAMSRTGPTSFAIDVSLAEPGTLIIRQFYFPTWKLANLETGKNIPLSATAGEGLISFSAATGSHSLNLSIKPHPVEYAGLVISFLSLLCAFILYRREQGERVGNKAAEDGG